MTISTSKKSNTFLWHSLRKEREPGTVCLNTLCRKSCKHRHIYCRSICLGCSLLI